MANKPVPPDKVAAMRTMYSLGLSYDTIAERMCLARSTVRNYVDIKEPEQAAERKRSARVTSADADGRLARPTWFSDGAEMSRRMVAGR